MIILLLMLYPSFELSELVGTDLVQAVPLVASAALGHVLFGDFKLALTASILVGAIPGVFIGAQLSSRAPDHVSDSREQGGGEFREPRFGVPRCRPRSEKLLFLAPEENIF